MPAIGVVVILAVVWAGIRMFGTKPQSEAVTDTVSESRPDASDADQAAFPAEEAPTAQASANAKVPASAAPGTSVAIQEVLPEVPQRSRRTIRGHVRVSVRLIVDQDGTVFAALAEQRGPSRYFERLAIDAAKKWTFTPTDDAAQRLMLVKFDFTRNGATADAMPLK